MDEPQLLSEIEIDQIRSDDRNAPCQTCRESFHPDHVRDGNCLNCIERNARRDAWLARVMRGCGVSERHAHITGWDQLCGTQIYRDDVAHIRAFIESKRGETLAILGGHAKGKTQIGVVAVLEAIRRTSRTSIIVDAFGLSADLKGRFTGRGDGTREWTEQWAALELLVIDDIGNATGSEWTGAAVRTLLERRHKAMRPTLLIGDVAPADVGRIFGHVVAARIGANRTFHCHAWPDRIEGAVVDTGGFTTNAGDCESPF